MISKGIYIINLNTNERQPIMMVPKEIRFEPESQFKVIASMGRNNPFYHYTGAEDTIEFDISWYATEEDRGDVMRACRTLEAWSKSDGDDSGPPDIQISWGDLFRGITWKMVSAPYVPSLFDRPHQMMPTLATQHLVFKKITEGNLTHEQIRGVTLYDKTRNIIA